MAHKEQTGDFTMMIRKTQILGYLGASAAALSMASSGFAANPEPINIEAQFRQALVLTEINQIDFTPATGSIDYLSPVTGASRVTMATNGDLAATGNFSTALTLGTAGQITITGEPATGVSVSCRSTGMFLSDNGGTPVLLPFDQAQIEVNAAGTGDTYAGADYQCLGIDITPYAGYTLDGGGSGVIRVGGRISGVTGMGSAVYTSANSGGVPASVKVIYTP
jgi:hypothetical protein